jgi:thiaminase/transcriptional activator TenA
VSFSADLRAAAKPIWEAQHAHPFVRGIGDGTLERARFDHYVRQDYLFLIEYGRMLALGAARAPDLATMARFAQLTQEILVTEMDLHRSYAAELGIHDLETERMTPTTRAYTDFLVRVAATGDFAELVAALLPCMWGYAEIGANLAAHGRPDDERYARWIDTYASEEFAQLATWCRELMDAAAARLAPGAHGPLVEAFVTSSRYELAFWQAAWEREAWPV